MRRRLNWIEVLNEQTLWRTRHDFNLWFDRLAGRPAHRFDATVDSFEEALDFMRRQVFNIHFDETVDLIWLDTQLKTVTLGLLHYQGAQEGADSELPRFRARVKGLNDSDLLRAVKDSLLVDFAEFIGEYMDTGQCEVTRCAAMHRRLNYPATILTPPDCEARWRDEINPTRLELEADWHRCAKLVVSDAHHGFCSDDCQFSSSPVVKANEPAPFIEKPSTFRGRPGKRANRR